MPATIEWDKIGQLLWAAPAAGLAVAITFALLVMGIGRAEDARRDGATTMTAAYSVLAAVAALAFLAVVVFGVRAIVVK